MAAGAAAINQCPPGGAAGIVRLAELLGCDVLPLNPAHGTEKALTVAVIDESLCIGCTLCIQACPVDAIVGAAKRVPVQPERSWTPADADAARARFEARRRRLACAARERDERLEARALAKLDEIESRDDRAQQEIERKKSAVRAAIERARARRQAAAQGGQPQ
jgi:electron transport complex protein RnfB